MLGPRGVSFEEKLLHFFNPERTLPVTSWGEVGADRYPEQLAITGAEPGAPHANLPLYEHWDVCLVIA